jgi:hypothetical protein
MSKQVLCQSVSPDGWLALLSLHEPLDGGLATLPIVAIRPVGLWSALGAQSRQ